MKCSTTVPRTASSKPSKSTKRRPPAGATPRPLEPLETLALSKCISTSLCNGARDLVEPGGFEVDARVHVAGSLLISPDCERRVTARVPWQQLALRLAARLRPAELEAVLAEVMDEGFVPIEAMTRAQERADHFIASMKESTRQTVRGAVRSVLTVQRI